MSSSTLIIGAGISGLLLAQRLQAAGQAVTVLEKSRGVGGRMATKRVGAATFDQGAQFFTARAPEFVALAEEWKMQGLIRDWAGGPHPRYFCPGGMTALPKRLAEGLDVRREHKVTAARHQAGRWTVEIEAQTPFESDRLIFTAPVAQALAVLKAGQVNLPDELAAGLAGLGYHPCLALLVVLDEPSAVPPEGLAAPTASIRWMADNTKKGISPGVAAAVTIHATPDFAEANYAKSEAEVAALLLPDAQAWFRGNVVSATLHRWRFSEPRSTYREPFVWQDDVGLGFAGDAFGGPKVEGAALSGLGLARRLTAG
jgi:renalase